MSEEGLTDTTHSKIHIGKPTFESMDILERELNELNKLFKEDDNEIIKNKMEGIVLTYHREDSSEVAAK